MWCDVDAVVGVAVGVGEGGVLHVAEKRVVGCCWGEGVVFGEDCGVGELEDYSYEDEQFVDYLFVDLLFLISLGALISGWKTNSSEFLNLLQSRLDRSRVFEIMNTIMFRYVIKLYVIFMTSLEITSISH